MMPAAVRPTASRARLLAALVAVPAVLAMLAVVVVEGGRWRGSRSPLFADVPAESFASALERDDVRGAYAFIRAGQDPNGLIAVRHPTLTGGRWSFVPPVLWAVANDARQSLPMLLTYGVRLDAATGEAAACLAAARGLREMADLVERYRATSSPPTCPDVASAEEMLQPR